MAAPLFTAGGNVVTSKRRSTTVRSAWSLFAVIVALLQVACDETFVALAESERTFSVFGYLDPAADTQWVRVTPTRPVIFTSREPLSATVELKALGSGKTIVLRDSVFAFPVFQQTGADSFYVHNFWTDEPIEPGEVYEFKASAPDGLPATATVAIPAEFPITVALNQVSQAASSVDQARVDGTAHIAFVRVDVYFHDGCGNGLQVQNFPAPRNGSGSHVVQVSKLNPLAREGCGDARVHRRMLRIIGSQEPWPTGPQFDIGALGASAIPTNLTNGVGFLGGVLTRTVPYEPCTLIGPDPRPTHCELSYGPEKATVRGILTDVCGARILPNGEIALEELPGQGQTHRKMRPATTDLTGLFVIQGLDPGLVYELRATHLERDPDLDEPVFDVYVDTIGPLAPGGEHTHNVSVPRLLPC